MPRGSKVWFLLAWSWVAIAYGQSKVNFTCGTFQEAAPAGRSKGYGYATVGPKSVLVIRVDFTNAPGAAVSFEQATNVLAEVDQFFRAVSFLQFSLPTIKVTPVLRLSGDAREYASNALQIATGARAAAEAAGFSIGAADFVIYSFPAIGFPHSGYAVIGGKGMWIPGGNFIPSIIAHEIGHNLGLQHAASWTTPDDSLIGPGTAWDYGNSYDVMGNSPYFPGSGFNGNYRYILGWLTDSDVHTANTNGVYRIHAIDGEDTPDPEKRYTLRVPASVPINGVARDYWLDYRKNFSYEHIRNGVLIQAATARSLKFGNLLLDMTPGTESQNDAALVVGQTFTDSERGISITPKSVDSKRRYIDVQIKRHMTGNSPPRIFDSPSNQTNAPNTQVSLSMMASDPDGDPMAYWWDFGDESLPSPLNSYIVGKSWTKPGVYPIQCTVSDMKGGVTRRTFTIQIGTPTNHFVSGHVTAGTEAVSGARVTATSLAGYQRHSVTDDMGFYFLPDVRAGSNTIQVIKAGYSFAPKAIVVGSSTTSIGFSAILPLPKPFIYSVSPKIARVGESITIAGINFGAATEVHIGNISAAFALHSPEEIIALVPSGISLGHVQVTAPAGIAISPSLFTVDVTPPANLLPGVARIEPPSGPIGASVKVVGTNLSSTTSVRIGSRVANYYGVSDSELVLVVPAGAVTASIVVVTPNGTAVSPSPFQVETAPIPDTQPSITSFFPQSGYSGDRITIIGENLSSVTNVYFGSARAPFATVSGNEISATVPADAVTTNLVVFTTNGMAVSESYFFVDIPQPVSITTHPIDGTAHEGGDWTFTVAATGSGPLLFRWFKDAVELSETNAVWSITNITATHAGSYTVEVRNKTSSSVTLPAILRVITLAEAMQQRDLHWQTSPEAPWIPQERVYLDDPLAAESSAAANESWIESSVDGPVRLTFWWQLSAQYFDDAVEFSINGTKRASITGPTTWTKFTTELGAGPQLMRWTRRGANAVAHVTQVQLERLWITQQPRGVIAVIGEPVTLNAHMVGAETVQWFRNGIALPGATNPILRFDAASPAEIGDYVVIVNAQEIAVTSIVARVSILPAEILTHPKSQHVIATSNATFSIAYRTLAPSFVQWFWNGELIAGATNATLSIYAMPSSAGDYQAIVTNHVGSVTSAVARLTVTATAPVSLNPVRKEYLAFTGEQVVLDSEFAGDPPPLLQWRRNGRIIRGANGPTLSFSSIRRANQGVYRLVGKNPFGTVTQQFRVRVRDCVIIEHPMSQQAWAGDAIAIAVQTRSQSPVEYQWRYEGAAISGAQQPTLHIPYARISDSGKYDVILTVNGRRLRSAAAHISVLGSAPQFTQHPYYQAAGLHQSATFASHANAHPPPAYQWFFEDSAIFGANLPWLTVPVVTMARAGKYFVVASNEFGMATSAPAFLALAESSPHPVVSPNTITTLTGNWAVLRSLSGFSPPANHLQWWRGESPIASATNAVHVWPAISWSDAGKYRLSAENDLGQGTSKEVQVHVTQPRRLDVWHRRSPPSRSEHLSAIAYGNGALVASGENGSLLTSTNGREWTDVSLQTTCAVSSVAFAGGMFIALVKDYNGILLKSSHGKEWTSTASPSVKRLLSICSANGQFIVAAEGAMTNLIIATSPDGDRWAESHLSIPASPVFAAGGPALAMAAGATNIVYTVDGTKWNSGPSQESSGIAWGDGKFIAVGSRGRIWTSTNAIEWDSLFSGTGKDLRSVVYNEQGFFACGEDGTAVTSADGITWRPLNTGTTLDLNCATAHGNKVFAGGEAGAIVVVDRGVMASAGEDILRTTLNSITRTDKGFAAVGDGGVIMTSVDGRAWITHPSPTGKDLLSVTHGSSGLIAVGEDGRIVQSHDGTSWRTINSPVSVDLQRVSFLNGRFYAIGDDGALLSSATGTQWARYAIQLPGHPSTLSGIAFHRGLYVTVGGFHHDFKKAESFIAISVDGISWQPLDVNFGKKLRGIISRSNGFMAIGNDGLIAWSPDGFRWRHQFVANEGDNLRAILELPDGMLVTVGNRGLVFSSEDGTNWVRNRLFTSKNLHDLAYDREALLAVATDGTIFAAEHLLPVLIPERSNVPNQVRLHIEPGARSRYWLQQSLDLNYWTDFQEVISSNGFRAVLQNSNSQHFYRLKSP